MNLVAKYILKNIYENKARSLLVLLSIAVSTALFFATMGMNSTCKQMYVDQAVRLGGSSDIKISVNDVVGESGYIDNSSIDFIADQLEYSVGIINSEGLYNPTSVENSEYVDAFGIDLSDLELYNSYSLKASGDLSSFKGNKAIISTVFAKNIGVSVGDEVEVKLGGQTVLLSVEGIAEQTGFFLNESNGYVIVVPRDLLEELLSVKDESNLFFVKVSDEVTNEEVINALSEKLDNCSVGPSVNESDLNQAVNTVVMPFTVSSLTVIFMSVFIIFTSFNLITLERMPAIGTLRSIGVSKKKMKMVLSLESLVWGIAGGIVGCLLGSCALYTIVVAYVKKLSEGTKISVSITGKQIVATIIFSVILTMVSAIPPIFRALKKPTKNIILNISEVKQKKEHKGLKLAVLLILFAVSIVVPHMMGTNLMGMIVTIVCMTIILVVMILIIPYAINFVSNIISKSGNNTSWLAVRNIETNKSLLNIVRLLTIAISCILIITNISNVISNTITSVYDKYHLYDISLSGRNVDESFNTRLSSVEGVDSFANSYELSGVEIEEAAFYFNTFYGIDNGDFFNFMGADISAEAQEAIANINEGRNLILTNLMASKLGLSVGDTVHVVIDNKSYPYTITGLIESSFKLGNIGFVSSENLQNDTGITYYTNTYIKAAKNMDVEAVRNNIKAEFLEELISIQTLEELVELNRDLIVSIFRIINAYAILSIVIGIIGIVNNIMVCFMERERELAMYRTVGMSMDTMKELFIKESLLIGGFGICFSFIGSTGILNIIPSMLSYVFGNVTMEYNLLLYLTFLVVGLVVMCAISIIPIKRSAKLNIIENLKYE